MSIFQIIGQKFGKVYDKNASVFASEFVRQTLEFHPLFAGARISLKDGYYLGLKPAKLAAFMQDKVGTPAYRYKAESFDCDDFAACARADVLLAGHNNGFGFALFVAEIVHIKPDGFCHDANLIMDSAWGLWFYEPQTGEMTQDLASKIKSVEEVWG